MTGYMVRVFLNDSVRPFKTRKASKVTWQELKELLCIFFRFVKEEWTMFAIFYTSLVVILSLIIAGVISI